MSKQVVPLNSKFSGVSDFFLKKRKNRKNFLKTRFQKKKGVRRVQVSFKKFRIWNTRQRWIFRNRSKFIRRVQLLFRFWVSKKYEPFKYLKMALKGMKRRAKKPDFFKFLKGCGSSLESSFKKINIIKFKQLTLRSKLRFFFTKYYTNRLFKYSYIKKLTRRFIIWKYYPQWVLEKFYKKLSKKIYRIKRIFLRKFLKKIRKIPNASLYTISYINVVSRFLYGSFFKVLSMVSKLDLQKYSKSLIKIKFNFIGGVALTPNIYLKYLLYKLARLHLPTEMIPKFLYKFKGFYREVTEKIFTVEDQKEKFKMKLLGKVYVKKQKAQKSILKYVRAVSPFLKGLLFKCNGRFTRKQDVSAYAF